MGHHKRKRPKNRRAGCIFCKPQKANNVDAPTKQENKARLADEEQGVPTKGKKVKREG